MTTPDVECNNIHSSNPSSPSSTSSGSLTHSAAAHVLNPMGDTDEERARLLTGSRARNSRTKQYQLCFLSVFMLVGIGLGLAIGFGISYGLKNVGERKSSQSSSGTYRSAAVASDAAPCSTVGVEILKNKGGNAVDAAIASIFCLGVVNLHSTGIGGGGFMLYYNSTSQETFAIDFRETAPLNASTYMYNDTEEDASSVGGLAIAVPGQLRGLEMASRKFGSLQWQELVEPAEKIARDGFPISDTINAAIQEKSESILSGDYPGLQELLAPNGQLLKKGDILKQEKLADTLHEIAEKGADYFYHSEFTEEMVGELQEGYDSIITVEDFHNYSAIERNVTMASYEGLKVLGVSPPSGGAVLGLILNILDGYNFTQGDFGNLSYHRTVEAFKFAYGQRLKLGDPDFNDTISEVAEYMLNADTAMEMFNRIDDNMTHPPDYYTSSPSRKEAHDHGTSHLSVLASNGDAVSVTTTINNYFGSLVRSTHSGIIFNDEMDDFSIPGRENTFLPTESNFIEPGKRPLSSTTPTIMVDQSGAVKMVVGASGGSRITTSVAQIILDVLGFEMRLSDSIPQGRLHHQLYPDYVAVEQDFPKTYQAGLKVRGHEVQESSTHAVVQGIHVDNSGLLQAMSDPRKGGAPDGY